MRRKSAKIMYFSIDDTVANAPTSRNLRLYNTDPALKELDDVVAKANYESKAEVQAAIARQGLQVVQSLAPRKDQAVAKQGGYADKYLATYEEEATTRNERMANNNIGPEPPNELRVLPRDSLVFPSYNCIGKVKYEAASESTNNQQANKLQNPLTMQAGRNNPEYTTGTWSLCDKDRAKTYHGPIAGMKQSGTNKKAA